MKELEEYFQPENAPEKPSPDTGHFPEDVRKDIATICSIWPFPVPTKGSRRFGLWIKETRELQAIVGGEGKLELPMKELLSDYSIRLQKGEAYDIAGIQSLTGPLRGMIAKKRIAEGSRRRYVEGPYSEFVER